MNKGKFNIKFAVSGTMYTHIFTNMHANECLNLIRICVKSLI